MLINEESNNNIPPYAGMLIRNDDIQDYDPKKVLSYKSANKVDTNNTEMYSPVRSSD